MEQICAQLTVGDVISGVIARLDDICPRCSAPLWGGSFRHESGGKWTGTHWLGLCRRCLHTQSISSSHLGDAKQRVAGSTTTLRMEVASTDDCECGGGTRVSVAETLTMVKPTYDGTRQVSYCPNCYHNSGSQAWLLP